MFTKAELRAKAQQIRSILDMEKISEKIVENIINAEIFQVAENIMIFYPLNDEINLLPLMNETRFGAKNYYLPKMQGEELVVCPYKKGDTLTKSRFNTQEPLTEPVDPMTLDIIFLPALMVGKDFHRLGYGKGYYDKFLAKNAHKAIRIVPISSLLVKETLPADEFDEPFDVLVDET